MCNVFVISMQFSVIWDGLVMPLTLHLNFCCLQRISLATLIRRSEAWVLPHCCSNAGRAFTMAPGDVFTRGLFVCTYVCVYMYCMHLLPNCSKMMSFSLSDSVDLVSMFFCLYWAKHMPCDIIVGFL